MRAKICIQALDAAVKVAFQTYILFYSLWKHIKLWVSWCNKQTKRMFLFFNEFTEKNVWCRFRIRLNKLHVSHETSFPRVWPGDGTMKVAVDCYHDTSMQLGSLKDWFAPGPRGLTWLFVTTCGYFQEPCLWYANLHRRTRMHTHIYSWSRAQIRGAHSASSTLLFHSGADTTWLPPH